ncbi:MAG: hypothetical protein Q8920_05995 [Bacillota bacterium]|nr:hypothetical protein [Bacillota bacterium]
MKNRKRIKTNLELAKEIRGTWAIKPVTRVHDSGQKKDSRIQRRKSREICKDELKEYHSKRSGDKLSDLIFLFM